MVYNELRKDYLLNRWVVIATDRSRRPMDFAKQKTNSEQNSVCPLCVGNEHMTPPAVMLYLKQNVLKAYLAVNAPREEYSPLEKLIKERVDLSGHLQELADRKTDVEKAVAALV